MDEQDIPQAEQPDNVVPIKPAFIAGVIEKNPLPEEKVPGSFTAKMVQNAKEKLGINVLKADEAPPSIVPIKPRIGNLTKTVMYSDEIAEEIFEKLLCGIPLARICSDPAMPAYSNVVRWSETMPDFRKRMEWAKREGAHYLADDCLRIADDETIDPAHKRIMVDTRIRLISKWNNKSYGDAIKLTDDAGSSVRFFIDGLNARAEDAKIIEGSASKK